MPDYDRLRYDELASISELLHGLSDDQWDTERASVPAGRFATS